MVYSWCTLCKGREAACALPDSHRAQGKVVWKADFLLGGRYGTRVRKVYPLGISRKEAEKFEALAIADYERGLYLPKTGQLSKTLFGEFLKAYKLNYVAQYMKGFAEENYRLSHALNRWEKRPIHTIQHADGELYIKERLKDEASKTTVNREITSLKGMMKWAVDNQYLNANPFEKLKKFKIEVIRVRWLTDQEIDILLGACRTLKDFDLEDLLIVGVNSGFRQANLERLEAGHILGDRMQALKTKSGKPYDVPINATLKETLEKLARLRAPHPLLNFKNLRGRWDRLVKFAGLWKADRDPNNVTIHVLRHTFAAQCLRRGIPLDVVCSWMGHYSIEFTRLHYGHLCPRREDQYINQLNLGGATIKELAEKYF